MDFQVNRGEYELEPVGEKALEQLLGQYGETVQLGAQGEVMLEIISYHSPAPNAGSLIVTIIDGDDEVGYLAATFDYQDPIHETGYHLRQTEISYHNE